MKVLLVFQNFVFVQELLVNCKDAIGGGKENLQLSLLLMTVLVDLAKLNYKPASGFFLPQTGIRKNVHTLSFHFNKVNFP